jgi:hypothetical protein
MSPQSQPVEPRMTRPLLGLHSATDMRRFLEADTPAVTPQI